MRGKRIFISYRHADAAAEARSIFAELREHFGVDRVFQDIRSLPKGEDFKAALERVLDDTAVVVAVIGPSWLGIVDEKGERRLDNDDDLVRQELAAALSRGIPLIPVLVGGASLPRASELPDSIARLPSYLGMHVSHSNFASDMNALLPALEARVGRPHATLSALRFAAQLQKTFAAVPYWARALGAVLGALLLVVLANPAIGAQAEAAVRIATRSPERAPISAVTDERIRTLMPRHTATSCRDFEHIVDGVLWGAAQAYVTCGAPPAAFEAFQRTSNRLLDLSCMCWPTGVGTAYYADFWVMEAFSANGVALRPDVVARIVASQTSDGWWPVHPQQQAQAAGAPLYLTALMVIALRRQAPLVDDEAFRDEIEAAIARGKDWLAANEPAAGDEWSDYPNNDRRVRNLLFGGMVLTALSDETGSERYRRLAGAWIENLEFSPAALYIGSDALVTTERRGRVFIFPDNYRHVPFSWEVCGLASIWPVLSFSEKVTFLVELERSIQREARREDPFGRPWVRDEVAYCFAELRRVRREREARDP